MVTEAHLIKKVPGLQNLSESQIQQIAEISEIVSYPPKHIIFEEGVMGKRLYFLVKGEVEVLFNTGKPQLTRIDTKMAECVMGCSALMEPYMYAATNRSITEVETLEIQIPALKALMESDCQIGMAIQQLLIQFMREYILKLRSMLGYP
jgi:CRP-like cAMP-binding protein